MTDSHRAEADAILVLGSINLDSTLRVDHLPKPGETVLAVGSSQNLGGKGANQAVAAALLGAPVLFAAAIGDDSAGEQLLEQLKAHRIDTRLVRRLPGAASGRAEIIVDSGGENSIVVLSGANERLTNEQVLAQLAEPDLQPYVVGLTQGELAATTVDAFAESLRKQRIRFVLNLAPVIPVSRMTLSLADPLILNEEEANRLANELDLRVADKNMEELVVALCAVARSVVVTLGARGAASADADGYWEQPSPVPQRVVDTTGAGDAFVGATAAALARGASLRMAVLEGVITGSFAVAGSGTTKSYPNRQTRDEHPWVAEYDAQAGARD